MLKALPIRHKVLLIAGLFLMPILLQAGLFLQKSRSDLAFATHEVKGVSYLEAVWPVMTSLVDGLATPRENGDDKPLKALIEASELYDPQIETSAYSLAVIDQLRQLRWPQEPLTPGDETAAASLHLRTLVRKIGDNSNLILDPSLDRYYSMELIVISLPTMVEALSELAVAIRIASDRGMNSAGAMSPNEALHLQVLAGRLGTTAQAMRQTVGSAISANPDGTFGAALGSNASALFDAVKSLQDLVVARGAGDTDLYAVKAAHARVLTAASTVWHIGATQLKTLLTRNIQATERVVYIALSITAIVTTMAIFLAISLRRSIIDRLNQLSRRIRALVDDALDADIPEASSKDEVGALARDIVYFRDQIVHRVQAGFDKNQALSKEISAQHADLQMMSQLARIGVWRVDLRTQDVFWSKEVRRIHEVDDNYVPSFESGVAFYDEHVRDKLTQGLEACIATGQPWECELPFITAKGNRRWVRVHATAVEEDGAITKLVGAFQDVTDAVAAREENVVAQQRLELATESAHIGLWDWDVKNDRFWSSQSWWDYLGFASSRGAVPDLIADQTIHGDDLHRVHENRRSFFAEGRSQLVNEFRHIDGKGNWRWILSTGRATGYAPDGSISRVSGVYIDIHERKLAAEKVAYAAHHDVLTGLANRAQLKSLIAEAVRAIGAGADPFAIMVLDLDRFKAINDTFGHAAGDEVLMGVANRMRSILRGEDVVARLGGDEFALLLRSDGDLREKCAAISSRILQSICMPFMVAGQEMHIGVSIGVAIAPIHGDNADTLIRNADAALYKVKLNGKNSFRIFDAQLEAEALERRQLEADLRLAQARNELLLNFQPEVNLQSGRIVAAEALIRWRHPTRGMVPPDMFISIAEETGLIVPIGEWVIEQACIEAAQWADPIIVAVNLSAGQLGRSKLVDVVVRALTRSGLSPQRLEIEVTETIFLRKDNALLADLLQLSEMGVRLALDDFGTGYSSLGYLKKLPFDKIKIDKSFVEGIGSDPQSAAIVCAVTSLARSLDIDTTAEGIETEAQAKLLTAAGCTLGQGYHFGRPLPSCDLVTAAVAPISVPAPEADSAAEDVKLPRRAPRRKVAA